MREFVWGDTLHGWRTVTVCRLRYNHIRYQLKIGLSKTNSIALKIVTRFSTDSIYSLHVNAMKKRTQLSCE